ncbi:MAG TPA: phosphoribosyltransferase family protein [Rhizomicrobium sp.]|nr:phosphoribosyltransferase family protein [Rhizomicrobium sp.]
MQPFADRADAGRRLAAALSTYKATPCVVLALPRGGVAVAAEVALALPAPLGLLLVRKIGAPMQPELALGAVVDGTSPIVVRNDDVIALTGTSDEEFGRICAREQAELERRRRRYLADRLSPDVGGKVAIVVDDGIATGATMRAALKALRQRAPSRVVLAVPVAPPDSIASLRADTDDVVCLEMPDDFLALGFYYGDFRQLSDEDVVNILKLVPSAD